jgi:MFS family permease
MLPRSAIKPEPARTPFPLRAVLQNRDVVILIVAYTTSIWGAVGLRQWVVVFLGFCAGDPARTDWSMLTTAALINLLGVPAGAEILSLLGYSIVPALLPQIMDGWSLSSTQGGWLAGIISGGYMLGVLPLVAATDRAQARTVYLASAAISVVASFGLAFSDAFAPALSFRALNGLALAGMYMPGLRALTDGIDGPRRARVAALYTSSFTIGTAVSFLLGRSGVIWGWRAAFLVARKLP